MSQEVKQVIVMRKDLGMRKGKMIAQGSHASIAFLTNRLSKSSGYIHPDRGAHFQGTFSVPEREWIEGRFKKITVSVDSEEELLEIHKAALESGVQSTLVKDAGLTEFKEPTFTCLALGPDYPKKIDPISGHLKLL